MSYPNYWYDKNPPLYVWDQDCWEREADGEVFKANVQARQWKGKAENIDFPKKCKVMSKHE